ncbi:1-acyl-sn-glycerol-3-phosphate acyltransferase [Mycolicibacterium sp. P9-64]|uniref:lysophospholipid acyltransferase family protein n=1 Tax=Mycolicibacterium sp. P9-64 TaxID=2024612 RepID=UPI0011EC1165|nr:lysophospholipid acyltransferase family protein [Mycolicibacterium sp. P9-64]KAA0085454.1 1-acyl-sn-glycerol-3-phosphate acyltransferase [Mycolicibacterium sp. P9-64]
MEPVFRSLEIAGRTVVRVTGTRITYRGLHNIPSAGGAVVAINHTSYVDFLPAALAATQQKRRLRYMIKAEMQDVRPVGFLIRHTKTIPVDRRAGADAYVAAVGRLREGELVGVYPEATISRSFELKEFKTGAARMAIDAHVPIIPLVVWGAQRIWTKDHPKRIGRNKIPITVAVDPPLVPSGSVDAVMAELRDEMTTLLHRVQQDYPHPDGEYWVPRRLGGSAPTPEEATVLDEIELADRARKQTDEH